MDGVRRFFYGPTPEEQRRTCKQRVRENIRKLEKAIKNLEGKQKETRILILNASKRGQRNPSQQKQVAQETRTLARELVHQRRQYQRLITSKATLESVGNQIDTAFTLRKIEGSIKSSTGVMKDVNQLVSLPELTGTMKTLSQELVKAGIIEEMVGDSMPNNELLEDGDEEAEAEVDKVLSQVLKDKVKTPAAQLPSQPVGPVQTQPDEEDEELDSEEMLAQMRGRLEALKS